MELVLKIAQRCSEYKSRTYKILVAKEYCLWALIIFIVSDNIGRMARLTE
jgi:hypothetical protein